MDYGKLIEPSPVPFSFGAPGWYVLGVLCLLVVLCLEWLLWRHPVPHKYRKYALLWLTEKEAELSSNSNYTALVFETTMLIKRVAMRKYGRHNIAGKRNNDFIEYINSTWRARAFDEKDEVLFSNNIYSNKNITRDEARSFVSKAKQWIRQHV